MALMSSVIGHRGAAGYVRENTLASIEHAAVLGCSWVEIDATLLSDGEVVLFHDDTLERVFQKEGRIRDFDLEALRSLEPDIPTLRECLSLCLRLGLGLNIELKTHDDGEGAELAKAVEVILRQDELPEIVISSFDMAALRAFSGPYPIALLFEDLPQNWMSLAQELNAGAINLCFDKVEQSQIDEIQQKGLEVYLYTVNKKAGFNVKGENGVFSDYPDIVM